MSTSAGKIFLSVFGFSAGIAAGMLLAPKTGKESRKWMQEQSKEAKNWVEYKGHRILKDSEQRLNNIRSGMQQMLPDLYEATEALYLEEGELEDSI